jgi:glycosyltransferase involved in cell wall biosynthesis
MNDTAVVVIAAYNEAAGIAAVIRAARAHVREVVVVDDGSTDATAEVARQAGARVLSHPVNRGKGAAIATGLDYFRQCGASFVVLLDADGQHDPSEIPALVRAAETTGAGVVVGTRMKNPRGMPLLRRLANRVTSWVTGRLAQQAIADSQCGYRLLSRAVVADLKLSTSRFETETEMLIQAGRSGHKIVSVPVRTIYEAGRVSRIRPWRDTLRFLRLVRKYWR